MIIILCSKNISAVNESGHVHISSGIVNSHHFFFQRLKESDLTLHVSRDWSSWKQSNITLPFLVLSISQCPGAESILETILKIRFSDLLTLKSWEACYLFREVISQISNTESYVIKLPKLVYELITYRFNFRKLSIFFQPICS